MRKCRVIYKSNSNKNRGKFIFIEERNMAGITLIALVITIIVLLILAGISITTLTGENGILVKADTAKIESEKEQEQETLKLILNEWQIEKREGKKTLEVLLKETLGNNNVFYDETKEQYTVLTGEYVGIIDVEGVLIDFYKNTDQKGNATEIANNIHTAMGKIVSNYKQGNQKWEIFYADNNNIYLILQGALAKTPLTTSGYNGTEDFSDLTNFPAIEAGWLDGMYNSEKQFYVNKTDAMKAVEYLLDKTKWTDYVDSKYAEYAIGGPTLEMLSASMKAGGKEEVLYTVVGSGYYNVKNYQTSGDIPTGSVWACKNHYRIAFASWGNSGINVGAVSQDGRIANTLYNNSEALRPVVCLKSEAVLTKNEEKGEYEISIKEK